MGTHGWWNALTEIEMYDESSDLLKQMEKVARLRFQGENHTAIAKQLNLKRAQVIQLDERYREILINDAESKDIARDLLHQMRAHFDHLIKEYYDLLDDLRGLTFSHNVAAQINAALKAIADLEARRLDFYQKAGMFDGAELGDELAAMEEEKDFILNILRNDLCPSCSFTVRQKIKQYHGEVDVPALDEDAVEGEVV